MRKTTVRMEPAKDLILIFQYQLNGVLEDLH
nr:MAG TPA: hypothetical protein [Caudoviricetes sp.]